MDVGLSSAQHRMPAAGRASVSIKRGGESGLVRDARSG
jgi:hypothetical protein